MNKQMAMVALVLLTMITAGAQTKVYLIPTLHGMHQTNQQYTYDSIYATVQRLRPDVIAVEIRSEDIASDTAYLKANYPYEMWMMRYWFPGAIITGFDWVGKELEGKPIPNRYWKDYSRIKALQRLLQTDTVYQTRLSGCQLYTDERMNILQQSSLKGILQSNDAILIKEYYNCLDQHLKGSDYEELPQFYTQRNQKLQEHVLALVKEHEGKTIVVLTGDDHYPYLREYLIRQKVPIKQLY